MALEHERRLRSPSPPGSSGRDSPLSNLRAPRRQLEDESTKNDKPYRRWATQLERALSAFDAPRLEWPDYISALGRLLKAVQNHPPNVDSIPHKHGVANKLAQCLDPSLPSGVHQKALELYDTIFTLIGKDALARDLPVFFPGLSPVLSFASLSIRPVFLTLLEKHIVALNASALRPALRSLLLCLLPGLEEENSEDFERTLKLVDNIRERININLHNKEGPVQGFGDEYFWQCLFLSAVTGSTRRQGILVFLLRRLPKLEPARSSVSQAITNGDHSAHNDPENDRLSQAAEAVVSPEPGLLVRCFAAGLEDEQALLQRGFLDLLLSHLPLHSPVFTNRVGHQDLQRLVLAATAVVARRDMSLNRRLWSWFLGPGHADDDNDIMSPSTQMLNDRKNNKGLAYFQQYGITPLSNSILGMFHQRSASLAEKVRPYRITLSLMDRWEIGNSLVPHVFIPGLSSLKTYKLHASESEYQEVLRSASGFFDGIESGLIWAQVLKLVESSLGNEPIGNETRRDRLGLASFVLSSFNVRDEEMMTFHIPLCCVYTLACIIDRKPSQDTALFELDEETMTLACSLVEQLVDLMPERAQLNSSFRQGVTSNLDHNEEHPEKQVMQAISSFYAEHDGDLSSSPPPFSSQKIAYLLISMSSQAFTHVLRNVEPPSVIALRAKILSVLIAKTPDCQGIDLDSFSHQCTKNLGSQKTAPEQFTVAQSITRVLINVFAKLSHDQKRILQSSGIVSILVEVFWSFLSPSTPKYHVESVRTLWQLDTIDPAEGILESSVSRFIAKSLERDDPDDEAEAARQFAVLWTHSMNIAAGLQKRGNAARRSSLIGMNSASVEARDHQSVLIRPLLFALEGLNSEGSELYFFLVSWLKSSGILYTVFDVLLVKLAMLEQQQKSITGNKSRSNDHRMRILHSDRTSECCYLLKQVSNLLRLPLDNINAVLASQGTASAAMQGDVESLHEVGIKLSLDVVDLGFTRCDVASSSTCSEMQCLALSILQQFLAISDQPELELPVLEQKLLDMLSRCTQAHTTASSVQVALLDTTMSYLKAKFAQGAPRRISHHRKVSSIDNTPVSSLKRYSTDRNERPQSADRSPPPEQLLKRLQDGITAQTSRSVLENWVAFLVEILPLYAHSLFQNLIPIVETFCKQINSNFQQLQESFTISGGLTPVMSETSLMALINGLEHTLAIAHDRLSYEETSSTITKTSESSQGFFGNVVSGVFASETPRGKTSSANSKLTVTLCLQDAVRICFEIWSWAVYGQEDENFDITSSASFSYSSSRLRNRARRLLDRMFTAETLECLETLVALRESATPSATNRSTADRVIGLLQTLDGSRPKRLMPAIFNSLYSRTNPSALEPHRMSSLTSDVKDIDLGVFLVEYTKSLDDDAMDEIWADCMTFLKDVLSNPLVHSSILPCLILFLQTLAEKVEKTNFGEQRRMRKDLGDLFQRLIQATFTSRPAGILQDPGDGTGTAQGLSVIEVLITVLPKLHVILPENDKQLGAVTSISNSIFGPLIHSKSFPESLALSHLDLLQKIVRISPAAKAWRKDVAEIYNHPKLFSCQLDLVQLGLLPILRQWALIDKDRLPDTLTRIPAPTTAGIMFGVGASAARLDADKKAQLNLRRVTLLTLSLDTDVLVPNMSTFLEKLAELLNATAASSPSSTSRAELFMLIQAVVLKTSAVHLSSLWPVITAELQKAITSALPDAKDHETYNALSLLQACKLLDLLLLIGPDDFQMHAWLFITDTIDSVYRPTDSTSTGLVDEMAEELSAGTTNTVQSPGPGFMTPGTPNFGDPTSTASSGANESKDAGLKRLLLNAKSAQVADMRKEEMVQKILTPWFAQLSLQCFEREYSMKEVDWEGCVKGLLEELFTERTMVS